MPLEFENMKEYTFSDDKWHLVQPFVDPSTPLTAKNRADTSISVYCTSDITLTEATLAQHLIDRQIDPPEIGGIFYEVSSKRNERMFIRCNEGRGSVAIRVFGTMDPMEDITVLSGLLSETILRLDHHIDTVAGNPHCVTKQEVGLGNIPNAITSDPLDEAWPETRENDVLPTLGALRTVYQYAETHVSINPGNPHGVTKAHVGLNKVENYPPATALEALDITNNQVYMTPWSTNELIRDIVVVAASMPPQIVIQGRTIHRPSGWTMNDITAPTELIVKTGKRTIAIKAGLQVAYAYRGICRVSKILADDMHGKFDTTMANGIHYLYVDLDEKGNFKGWGSTPYAPVTGVNVDAYDGDYFNYAKCEMVHTNGAELKRVYIGKAYFQGNELIDLVSVPLGDQVTIPVLTEVPLGKSALLTNPFIAPVETTALVELEQRWGETGWNDQTGVLAHPRPGHALDQIVVQVGLVGYVTRGSSSGTGFGAEFMTVTSPLRIAVRVKRPH